MHYLNVPYPDDNKLVIASSVTLWGEKKEWTKEELISQLKPMCEFIQEEYLAWWAMGGKGRGSGESPMYPEVQNCLLLKRHDSRNLKQRNEQGRGISLPFASILETRGGNFAREERLMKRATGRSLPNSQGVYADCTGVGALEGSWVTQSSDLDAKRQN